MLEIYKCLNSENPSCMWNIFQTKDVAYNLRTQNLLQLPSTNTLSYGNDSLSFRGAVLWNTLSDSIKCLATSASFKRSIKEWKGDNCSCKIQLPHISIAPPHAKWRRKVSCVSSKKICITKASACKGFLVGCFWRENNCLFIYFLFNNKMKCCFVGFFDKLRKS